MNSDQNLSSTTVWRMNAWRMSLRKCCRSHNRVNKGLTGLQFETAWQGRTKEEEGSTRYDVRLLNGDSRADFVALQKSRTRRRRSRAITCSISHVRYSHEYSHGVAPRIQEYTHSDCNLLIDRSTLTSDTWRSDSSRCRQAISHEGALSAVTEILGRELSVRQVEVSMPVK